MSALEEASPVEFSKDMKRKLGKTTTGPSGMSQTAVFQNNEENPYIRSTSSEIDDMGVSSSFFGGQQQKERLQQAKQFWNRYKCL